MIGPAGYRSCLARSQPRTTPSDEDLQAMRRAAWRTQGVIMLGPEDVRDDWTRQALINKTNRLYGRRSGGGRGAPGSSRTRSRAASSRRSGRRIRTDASWCITGRSTRLARCCAPAPSRRRCTTRTRASSAGGGGAGGLSYCGRLPVRQCDLEKHICQRRMNFPQKCRSKFPHVAGLGDQVVSVAGSLGLGGRPRRRGGGAGSGGVMRALARMCSGTSSACWRSR